MGGVEILWGARGRFNLLLNRCIAERDLPTGKSLHAVYIKSIHGPPTTYLSNHFTLLYSKCGRLFAARNAFDVTPEPNIYSFNTIMAAYAKNLKPHIARQLFDQNPCPNLVSCNILISAYAAKGDTFSVIKLFVGLREAGLDLTNEFTIAAVMKAARKDFALLSQLHGFAILGGFMSDTGVNNSLISYYSSNGFLTEAELILHGMGCIRDEVSYRSMIAAYVQHQQRSKALSLYQESVHTGIYVDPFTIANVLYPGTRLVRGGCLALMQFEILCGTPQPFDLLLNSCIAERNLLTGKSLHAIYIKSILGPPTTYLSNHFTLLYSKCGRLSAARNAFHVTPEPDIYSFNIIIAAYPKELQPHIAHQLFDRVPCPDPAFYTTLISAYAARGDTLSSIKLFVGLRKVGFDLGKFTISAAMTAACKDFALLSQLHAFAVLGGFMSYTDVNNTLISCYSKNGFLTEAELIFHSMAYIRDQVSYNSMIGAYSLHQQGSKALSLFQEMVHTGMHADTFTFVSVLSAIRGIADLSGGLQLHAYLIKTGFHQSPVVGCGLIDLYSKCRSGVSHCRKVFQEITAPDLVLWNTMISGYSHNAEFSEDAIVCFRQMQREGYRPNDISFVGAISGCSKLSSPLLGKQLHSLALKSDIPSNRIDVNNALITMYSRSGNLQDARQLFDRMPEQNTLTVNSLISGYAQHGFGTEALHLFEQMVKKDIVPTGVTFACILSACALSGKVEEGRKYFSIMTEIFGVEPEEEHYTWMIDLLVRAGKLAEAEKLIETMPFNAGIRFWGALLASSRKHGNVELAIKAAQQCLQLNPSSAASYVVLANLYADTGNYLEVAAVRKLMRRNGVKKNPGCSWIEINKRVHVFVAGDLSHPLIKEIYEFWDKMLGKMKQAGYVPDVRWGLVRDDGSTEGVKEKTLGHHSEKLAVAFGLLSKKHGEPILVRMKNLGIMCGNCHNAIKIISGLTARVITVKDPRRFHCFRGGKCSCGD